MALRAGYYGLKKRLLNKVNALPGIKTIGDGLSLSSDGVLSASAWSEVPAASITWLNTSKVNPKNFKIFEQPIDSTTALLHIEFDADVTDGETLDYMSINGVKALLNTAGGAVFRPLVWARKSDSSLDLINSYVLNDEGGAFITRFAAELTGITRFMMSADMLVAKSE